MRKEYCPGTILGAGRQCGVLPFPQPLSRVWMFMRILDEGALPHLIKITELTFTASQANNVMRRISIPPIAE